jgi:hypothetical protein
MLCYATITNNLCSHAAITTTCVAHAAITTTFVAYATITTTFVLTPGNSCLEWTNSSRGFENMMICRASPGPAHHFLFDFLFDALFVFDGLAFCSVDRPLLSYYAGGQHRVHQLGFAQANTRPRARTGPALRHQRHGAQNGIF